MEDLIWDQETEDFIPLFSIQTFSNLRNRYHTDGHYNFNRRILKLLYYDDLNIVHFIDNNTRITGFVGEVWNILSDYLNFTLVPMRLHKDQTWNLDENTTHNALLSSVEKNETQIIPKIYFLLNSISDVDYTQPFWRVRYNIYFKPTWERNISWMFDSFTNKLWISVQLVLMILSIAGYICEKIRTPRQNDEIQFDLNDHILYTVALAAQQGSVPDGFPEKSRQIYIITSFFSWFVSIAFNSQSIYSIMDKDIVQPFSDLEGLIRSSKYDILTSNGSLVRPLFENEISRIDKKNKSSKRIFLLDESQIYDELCSSDGKKMAVFDGSEHYWTAGKGRCNLVKSPTSYFETWVGSAVKKGFHKRAFDFGILRMYESGIFGGLTNRWFGQNYDTKEDPPFHSIDFDQVELIIVILIVGQISSLVILVTEYVSFLSAKLLRRRHNDNDCYGSQVLMRVLLHFLPAK
ncbi:hypothetical protein QAD02_023822 [Eretmocerus hayati]|uniref:Uncharacterized protein n=1 Tax=Eretmocerus hayati TaxID=131215 RepID=A0ACC2PX23_9HYME|nr:hypothetical protein QAD02_023822 [Eretmocerus hayati]